MNKHIPLRTLLLVPALILACNTAYAATTLTTVYPTGVYPTDLNNVQAAVNQGGYVLLKATNQQGQPQSFNFNIWNASNAIPPNSDVTLTANVVISGETCGANQTTIVGGCVPFYESNYAVTATINDIKFVNPQGAAIAIFKSSGIAITNNVIQNVLPYLDENGLVESSGMYIGGVNNTTITGPVLVAGNTIQGLDGTYEFGIGLFDVESSMNIASNTICIGTATDSGNGSVDSDAIAVFNSSGAAVLSSNNVSVGAGVAHYGILAQGPQTGSVTILANDVSIQQGATCYEGIGINGSCASPLIIGNTVTCDNEGANAIQLSGSQYVGSITGAEVLANSVTMENSYSSAIDLGGSVSNSSISLNLITGDASFAISAESDGTSTDLASSNVFVDDMIVGFSASDATYFFDTNTVGNLVLGPYTNVMNNGKCNTFYNLF